MEKPNIYYLEDSDYDFNLVKTKMKEYLEINLLPSANRSSQISLFRNHALNPTSSTFAEIKDILLSNNIRLIILDQQLNGENHIGAKIVKLALSQDPELKKIKIIIYSGADEPQEFPGTTYQPGHLDVFTKNKKSSELSALKLVERCQMILDLPDNNLVVKLRNAIDNFFHSL